MREKPMRYAALSIVVLAASGCAVSTATDAGPPLCLAAAPIHGSKQDSEETRRQVDAHNAVGAHFCGW